jgi:hypothetical protein
MIIRLICSIHPFLQAGLIRLFSRRAPSCLASSGAFNTTPLSVAKNNGIALTYWYLNDQTINDHYGGRITVRALITYPGVLSVTIIETDVTGATLKDMSQYELESFLLSDIP